MSRMPLSSDPHGDYLDPTLHDDPSARDDRKPHFCDECGEQVTSESECVALGLDPDAPRCRWCCRCTDCCADLYSALHEADTRSDAP